MNEEPQIRSTSPRLQIIEASLRLAQAGLNKGTAGNVSVRWSDGFLITPSGMPAPRVHPEDIAVMDMDGQWSGRRKPSSEWRMHCDIYRERPDVGAVIHTHAPFCVALAVHGKAIPAYHYMVAVAGGSDIRCAGYATFGTQELSDAALTALEGRRACLLAHHGMIATGPTLSSALALTIEVESLAEGYWRALQLGEPPVLGAAEMETVLERFRGYGENAQKA